MTEHGWDTDAWPEIYKLVMDADILVLAGPIWLGDNSSQMKKTIERLYACSSLLNDKGQYAYSGKVGGCLITGNEDGIKHCAMNVVYSCSTSATPFRHKPTRVGSAKPVRGEATETMEPGWTTTSRTATRHSCRGT
jgi:multimeric flavodoxin WrbA